MRAVIRKELADHFGSARFLIIMSLIFMVSFLLTHLAGQGIRDVLSEGGNAFLAGRTFLLLFTAPAAFFSLSVFLSLFGPLVSIVLGFDSINRERSQGTLSKILSQPIHRDEVILGKYLAGLITVAMMLAALLLLLTGMGLLGVGVVPTFDECRRLFVFWLLTVVYMGFWLGLSILISILFRSIATSAMAAAAMWILVIFFLPVLSQAAAQAFAPFADPQRPRAEELSAYSRVHKTATMVSPTGLYTQSSAALLDPTHRGSDQAFRIALMSRMDRYLLSRFQGGISFSQSMLIVMPDILLLVCFSILTFLLSYVVFVRQEVRSV
ncbi:MAG: ABC transporter permease [Deltaproteobacteria bacterium]|jgi:ABC-2 type transport system permease protein|nr:ABC transporter permease [Deltaproteobacteria bacterium]